MDLKRLALFFLLSMGIFYAWALLGPKTTRPVEVPPATSAPVTSSPTTPAAGMPGLPHVAGSDALAPAVPPVEAAGELAPRRVRVSNTLWNVEISNVGGRITSWQLPAHKEYGDATRPLDLVRRAPSAGGAGASIGGGGASGAPGAAGGGGASEVGGNGADASPSIPPTAEDSQGVLPLQVQTGDVALDQLLARAIHSVEVREDAGGVKVATIRWSDGAGTSIEKILTFREQVSVATVEARLTVLGQPRDFSLLWGPGICNHTAGERQNTYFRRGMIAWRAGGKVRTADRPDKAEGLGSVDLEWAALEDSFFTALFVPAAPSGWPAPAAASATRGHSAGGALVPDAAGKTHKKDWPDELVLAVPFTPSQPLQSLYAGPRERVILEGLDAAFAGGDRQFASLLQMGILQPIAVGMHHILIWLHAHTSSWGASIVLLTLIIRAAMFPLTHVSLKRMRLMQDKMKILKPREKVIQDRFRKLPRNSDNRLREHQERMALYQEVGIGPMETLSGCLPLLLSIPFFWALFQLLPNAPEFRHEPFLRIWSDLSTADPFYVWPIATAVTMFISSWMSMASAPVADPMQRNMLLLLPLMFAWICWSAPLGLVVYWTINNLVQLAQQYLLKITLPPIDTKTSPASSGRTGRKKT